MQDTVHSRRRFMHSGLTLLAAATTVPTFIDSTVLALADENNNAVRKDSGTDGKVLVIVQLSGGNDGLNTVCPYADDTYQRVRPGLAKRADDTHKINNYIGFNKNLTGFKELYDSGHLTVVQGVGYPNPNRSHFRSMDIWQSAIPEKEVVTTGWLGRYFDNTCTGTDPHVGVAIGDQAPLAMRGDRVTPLSFERPENYRYNGSDKGIYLRLNTPDVVAETAAGIGAADTKRANKAAPPKAPVLTPQSQLAFLTRTALDAQLSSDNILKMTTGQGNRADFPRGGFGDGLRTISSMIRGGLPTRVYYVSLGGFDTHANQQNSHDRLMQQLNQGVAAFWKEMKEQKNDQRVTLMCFSEFGRRVASNGSGGTDHGAAAPMFFIGNGLENGVLGKHPSLTDLDSGDLRFGIDFRSVYASVLQDWLDTPSKPILGSQFRPAELFKKRG